MILMITLVSEYYYYPHFIFLLICTGVCIIALQCIHFCCAAK